MTNDNAAENLFGATMKAETAEPDNKASEATDDQAKADRIFNGPDQYKSPFDGDDGKAAKAEDDTEQKADEKAGEKGEEQPKEKSEDEIKSDAAKLVTDLKIDTEHPMAAEFSETVASLGLDKDGAQKLIDMDLNNRQTFWTELGDDWQTEAKADPDFQSNVTNAKAIIKKYGDEKLAADLKVYRFGDNPNFIRLLGRVGRDLNL